MYSQGQSPASSLRLSSGNPEEQIQAGSLSCASTVLGAKTDEEDFVWILEETLWGQRDGRKQTSGIQFATEYERAVLQSPWRQRQR